MNNLSLDTNHKWLNVCEKMKQNQDNSIWNDIQYSNVHRPCIYPWRRTSTLILIRQTMTAGDTPCASLPLPLRNIIPFRSRSMPMQIIWISKHVLFGLVGLNCYKVFLRALVNLSVWRHYGNLFGTRIDQLLFSHWRDFGTWRICLFTNWHAKKVTEQKTHFGYCVASPSDEPCFTKTALINWKST